jgi:hypothetical protein
MAHNHLVYMTSAGSATVDGVDYPLMYNTVLHFRYTVCIEDFKIKSEMRSGIGTLLEIE